MFTGIVQGIGRIRAIEPGDGDISLVVDAGGLGLEGTEIGDSIAVNGACLTVTRLAERTFAADVSRETLSMTTLGDWRPGTAVNLEKAIVAGQALGGHYVTGHVDGVGEVMERSDDARSVRIEFEAPHGLGRYLARKGSVCIDGVSLTVNAVKASRFYVNLVPHTLEVTILGGYEPGTRVNLEVDIIARYVERLTGNS
jgi:riboflavin synthase